MHIMIEIDSQSPVATYQQIVLQIRGHITAGTLNIGDPLPPIRQMASDLEINPATVAKAYQILEKDGIIQTAGRRGTFVHARALPNLTETMHKEASEQVDALLSYWQGRGMTAKELTKIWNQMLQLKKEIK
jgi:GntR family transcriptional regulator